MSIWVLCHTVLKCYVIVDLKTGKLTHPDLGQLQLYVNYYDRERRTEGDSPTLGLILCADKNDAVVKYTLGREQEPKNLRQPLQAALTYRGGAESGDTARAQDATERRGKIMNPWVLTLNLELWNIELASAFERSEAFERLERLERASVLNWLNHNVQNSGTELLMLVRKVERLERFALRLRFERSKAVERLEHFER